MIKLQDLLFNEDLRKWLNQNWVDISRKDSTGKHPKCGASSGKKERGSDASRAYPKCVPQKKASAMSKKEKKSAVSRKRRKPNKPGKPDWTKTKPSK